MDLRILFIDKDFVICEKPVGISCESPGLPDLVKEIIHYDCYPVHRLDAGTGGVCILAFTKKACNTLSVLFQKGYVKKEYLAVLSGKPSEESGVFRDWLFHDKERNKSYVVGNQRKGVKEAVCEWKMLESVNEKEKMMSLIRVNIQTGRTHQIRAQFASRGLPLVGDRRYGSRIKSEMIGLWANHIILPHPSRPGEIEAFSFPPDQYPWNRFDRLR